MVRQRAKFFVAFVALSTGLAACGSGADDSGDDESPKTASTITVALSDFGSESLDPATEGRTSVLATMMVMYDSILEIGDDGSIVPGLAERWEVADDGVTWTFHLREGVRFHGDNGEVLASDAAFSLERWASDDVTNASGAIWKAALDRVEVVDDHTFKILTNGVRADLPLLLSPHQGNAGMVFSEKYMREAGPDFAAQSAAMNDHPIGSGPFEFVEHVRGSRYVFEAVDDHWRGDSPIERIEFVLVPEIATQVAMLKAGEADIIEMSADQIADLEASDLEVRGVPEGLGVGLLITGLYRPSAAGKPTEDARVRQALSLAIDRELILETLMDGRGTLPETPWNTGAATTDLDRDALGELAEEHRKYDPEEARKLLAEAGHPDGIDGIVLDTYARPGGVNLPQLAEIIAAQWSEAGIRAEIRAQDYGNYRPHLTGASLDDAYNAGEAVVHSSAPRFDAVGPMTTYLLYDGGSVQLLRNPQLDKRIEAVNSIVDDEERMEEVTKIFTEAHQEWVQIPLFNADSLYGVDPDTVGEWAAIPGFPFMGRLLLTLD